MRTECVDCGIEYEWNEWCDTEHPHKCCDCYDESLGMPEKCRSKPRPKRDE
jgi:hypothetical protein